MRPVQHRRLGRQVLPVIAGLLVASGLLRIGSEAGSVLAEEASAATAADDGLCSAEGGTEALLAAFRSREDDLAEREAQLADRIQALHVTETEVTEKIAALAAAEESLAATLAVAQTAASDDLARLTAVYESMKPANAAALFTEMDPAFAAGFLGMMRADAAAAIMSNLEPTLAYSISVLLAGRNANAPTE
jgi:flagellar motility protein MotE (MotC chaperone)